MRMFCINMGEPDPVTVGRVFIKALNMKPYLSGVI